MGRRRRWRPRTPIRHCRRGLLPSCAPLRLEILNIKYLFDFQSKKVVNNFGAFRRTGIFFLYRELVISWRTPSVRYQDGFVGVTATCTLNFCSVFFYPKKVVFSIRKKHTLLLRLLVRFSIFKDICCAELRPNLQALSALGWVHPPVPKPLGPENGHFQWRFA